MSPPASPLPGARRGAPRASLFAVALLAAAGCARCGKPAPPPTTIERFLPRGAVGAAVVPSVKALGEKLTLLESLKVVGFVAQLQGFDGAKGLGDSLVSQLGVDVRSAEAVERAGVDAARALGVGVLVSGDAYLVLPVKDEAKLAATLKALAAARLGGKVAGEERAGGLVVKTFSPKAGEPPVLGYVLAGGFALVSSGPGVARLASLAALPEGDSLATDPVLAASLARLPKDFFAWVFLPHGSPALADAPATSALATVSLSREALTVAVDAPWKGDPAQLAAFEQRPGPELLGYLPRDAFLVARYQGDPAQLAPFADALLGPHLAAAFAEAGFDYKAEVLSGLKPGAVAAVSLAPRPPMDKGVPTFDVRQTNPFSYGHLTGLGAVKAPEAALPTLEKVAAAAPRFGAQMTKKVDAAGQAVFVTSYAQGEGLHFAPRGELVFFASPLERLGGLLASDGKAGPPVQGLGDGGLTAALDLRKLAAAVRELPEGAWGLGGFAMKASTVRWLEATDDLAAVTVAVGTRERAVQARVSLALRLEAPKAAAP